MVDWFNGPEPIWHAMWEPMWAAAEENNVALSFHIGVGMRKRQLAAPPLLNKSLGRPAAGFRRHPSSRSRYASG